ncbi:unnamed protein product [Didymodactylos carnosus]|uniref:ribonuclease Z n=1 Tax=Didymodactylos carnosus TaxID=1234261 RepID=A0A8S2CWP0_9BILA|nr:unnamed protein product [Didymodactylos carnosus]CAF3534308.1 unnamed protein product [Didymodactylos carnosus]
MTVNCIKLLLIREYTVLLATKRSLSTDIFDLVRGMASSSSKKKNTSHTDQIIKSKKIIKDQGQQLGISSRINLQVVANGYAGTKKSVLLSTDQTNYLFNCGESTQRILTEKNGWDMKFSKISQLFVTRKSWDTLGGIVGLCISLKESKSTDITFHAPCDMLDLLKHWKGLDGFPNMTIGKDIVILLYISTKNHSFFIFKDQHDYQKADFIDSNFKIRAIPLRSTNFFTHQENKRQRLTSDNDLADFQLYPHDLVYAYLCETQPYPSTLSPELCAFHGVPFNHLRTQLKNGEDVTLENGRIIRSVDVVLPVEPPVKVLVLDCPSLCYMDAIEKSEINNHKYHAIIHMTSHDLLTNAAYRSEMKKMNTTHHIFLDENQKNVHSDALYRYQSQLNYIDDGLFPLLSYQTILKEGIALPAPIDNISQGITSTRISLRPVLGPDNSKQYLVQPEVNIEAMLENEQFKETFEAVKQQITAMHEIAKTGHSIPEIVFLGTGSACPSKPRNISGILIHIK